MKKIAIITGAGISKESGIDTFRDKDGLWLKFNPEMYASVKGWNINQINMNDFYNKRRQDLNLVSPNKAHFDLVELEKDFDVTILTQNVDDLHKRAGSSKIIYLHGELTKIRKYDDIHNDDWVDIGYTSLDLKEKPDYRPAVVFFGDSVPLMQKAYDICFDADIIIVIGTSLRVYPVANLLNNVENKPVYIIDPERPYLIGNVTHIPLPATKGVAKLINLLHTEIS